MLIMNNSIDNVTFKIIYKNKFNQEIINSVIEVIHDDYNIMYNVIKYLGSGTIGKVYLIESLIVTDNERKQYVIKIANEHCNKDLKLELKFFKKYFKKYNITHASHPLMFGQITKTEIYAIMYNYLGNYDLESIKKINYKISFLNNKLIIKQLITQLLLFNNNNIIHCDLKPPNVVINTDTLIVTIIDFGLASLITEPEDIYSTCYITSPESLATTEPYSKCLIKSQPIDISKHDNYGLFSIIINLLINKTFWSCINIYLVDIVQINKYIFDDNDTEDIFVYCWYKFYYNNIDEITNIILQNVIKKIELRYSNIKNKCFLNFDDFFDGYLVNHLDYDSFNHEYYALLKDFLKKLIHFDYTQRYTIQQLSDHPFLN